MKFYFELTDKDLINAVNCGEPGGVDIKLNYKPPYNWKEFLKFLKARELEYVEFINDNCYARNFLFNGITGFLCIKCIDDKNYFSVRIVLDNLKVLMPVMENIRRFLDLDADIEKIEQVITAKTGIQLVSGIRIPGVWDEFEAGVRAVCGQQISVCAAIKLVSEIVKLSGTKTTNGYCFPSPVQLAQMDFAQLRTTNRRKETLKLLADYCSTNGINDVDKWKDLKGIGDWTVNYVKMRGQSNPDIWLEKDLWIMKAVNKFNISNSQDVRPWRTYLGLQLWRLANV